MSGPHMCPHCGYNFAVDAPIERDGWSLSPDRAAYLGRQFLLSNQQAAALYAVAAGQGGIVTRDAVLNRISESEDVNLVSVVLCRVRRKLGDLTPIVTIRGRGFRWQAPQQAEAA